MLDSKKVLELLNENKIEELKEMIRIDMLTSDKKTSIAAGIKTFYNYIQKQGEARPILKKCLIDDDIQYITDSFIMLALKKEDFIDLFEKAKEEDRYPNVKNVLRYYDVNYTKEYDVKQLFNFCKLAIAEKTDVVFKCDDFNVLIDPKLLKLCLQGLQVNDGVLQFSFTGQHKPVKIVKNNGSIALIMPLRYNDETAQNSIVIE